MIPYGRQDVTTEDIDSVVEVLKSDFLTQGPCVPRFEHQVARRVGVSHAVAMNSATSALHVACLALGLGPGDRLWTVPNTFVASANCGLYCGAEVDFVDIDSATWNISIERLRQKLVEAKKAGCLPKVIVPVHFAGQPPDQEAIWELAQRYRFRVLEDASHSLGATRHGEPVGSCRWSDITVFSFHPVKIITSGEGGLALTKDESLSESMRLYRSQGVTRNKASFKLPHHFHEEGERPFGDWPAWYYEQQLLGFNYRLTDIQAALGASQLERLDSYILRRNELACRYDASLRDLPLQLPSLRPGNRSAFHLYVVRLQRSFPANTHRRVFDDLRRMGIGVNLHYMPVHLQPYYRDLGFAPGQYPEAEIHGRSAITLPLYPALSDSMQDRVIDCVRKALSDLI